MNDFTKEELCIIKDALLYFMGSTNSLKIKSIDLRDKSTPMIDNYCNNKSIIYCKCLGQWVCDVCHYSEKL